MRAMTGLKQEITMPNKYEITATAHGNRTSETIREVVEADTAEEAVARLSEKYADKNLSITAVAPKETRPG
jgi:hypothetical protein